MLVWFKLEKLMRRKIFALKALLFPTINFGLKKKAVGSPDFHFSIFADSTQHHMFYPNCSYAVN